MAIETLTDEERAIIGRHGWIAKTLRIIDAQGARIRELEQSVEFNYQARITSQRNEADLESQLDTRDARIAEACVILATPGTWSDFAARARKALTDG